MGMVLGHHIPGRTGPADAVDTCSYSVHFDGTSPSSPNITFRYDVRFRPDGLRVWVRFGGTSVPAFDNLFQYDIPVPWQLFGWVFTGSEQITNDNNVRSLDWHDNGTKFTMLNVWFSSFRRVDTVDQSATPYDISAGLGPFFASRTGIPGGEFLLRFNLETAAGGTSSGTHLFISRSVSNLDKFLLTVPHDVSTMVLAPVQTFDFGVFGMRMDQFGFSADHTKIYSVNSSGVLRSVDLTAPDDISAPFNFQTGVNINALPEGVNNLGVARGLNIRPDTGDLIYFGDQNNFRVRCWRGINNDNATDDDFSNVVLLLDFDGVDGATNITDLSPSGHTETFVGNAQVDTAVRALGQNTMLLDGAGDLLTFPDSIDWDFGTGDFTIEFNIDLDVLTSQTFMGNYLTGSGADKGISIELQAAGPDLRVLRGDDVLATVVWAGAAINTDFHIAVTRSGTDLRIFVDGSELVSVTDSSDFSGSVQPWRIGSLDGAAQFLDGNIGAVRVTKGTARYTSNFTAPSCFYPNVGAPASPIIASGSPSIIKPTSAGNANVAATALVEAGATIIEPSTDVLLPPSATEAAGDRIFAFSTFLITVDGTWEQLNTLPGNFVLYTKVAAGDATDDAILPGAVGLETHVGVKFTFKDIAGPGSWDFNAQGTTRNSAQTTFNVRQLNAFGIPAPSISIYCGVRIAAGLNAASGPGVFSDNVWTIPPTGGVILATKTQKTTVVTNTQWAAVNFNVQAVKTTYPDTGENWTGADPGASHNVHSRGWRYDHD